MYAFSIGFSVKNLVLQGILKNEYKKDDRKIFHGRLSYMC